MRRLLLRMSPALHLTRLTTAFAAVANVWFVVLWTHACGHESGTAEFQSAPLWLLLLGSACNALGLFGFATALNDVVDLRRDLAVHPERPLPSGRLSRDAAVALIVVTFGLAVLGATPLGMRAVLLTLLVGGAILLFNVAGKFVPAIGLVMLGLIYAGQMVVPNLALRFVWPVWLVMTHALLVGLAVHTLGRKPPALSARAIAFAVSGWAFWSAVIMFFGDLRNSGQGGLWPEWVQPTAAIGPAALAALFVVLAWRRVRLLGRGARAADKIGRYGALWLALYACTWLFGQGYWMEGWILTALAAAGFLGMTVVREAYALLEQPMGYRR
ncbi:MAG: hypothetical protein KF699_08350 [Phycisphaeraceae bacterium]|nr:hypothetical protein [Phycisphaeraceae bacterium]